MPELKHFSVESSAESMLAAIREDGAIILDSLVDSAALTALRAETDPYMETTANGPDEFAGLLTTRTGGLVMRSQGCRDLIQHPLVLGLCDEFLLPFCQRYGTHRKAHLRSQLLRVSRRGLVQAPLHERGEAQLDDAGHGDQVYGRARVGCRGSRSANDP